MLFNRSSALRFASALSVLVAVIFVSAQATLAQLPQTRIFAIFPPGAKAGEAVDVTITRGTDLEEIDGMLFNHPGITTQHKSGNTFAVKVAANVPPGIYECRAHALYGTSNPRCFVVGTLPEIIENNDNATTEKAQEISIGTVVNGRSDAAADVDFFKITAQKGQRLLFECAALRIDSRFQGELRLYTEKGRRIGRAISQLRRDDPLLDVTISEDGDYFLRVSDFVYGGSADYPYRLKIHTGPHIDFVVPPAGVPGSTAKYTLFGRNLPNGQPAGVASDGRQLQKLDVDITLPNTPDQLQAGRSLFARESGVDGSSYSFQGSNPVTITFAPKALIAEVEPNNEFAESGKITVPAEIAGQFAKRSDVDRFEFQAKAQQVFWIEVFGQRLGKTTDPYLTLDQVTKKEDGTETLKRLATQDDVGNTGIATLFDNDHDDIAYRFTVPADGLYRITLRDRFYESRGAPNLQYHLAIREEHHDYRLTVIPPAPLQNAAAGYQTWALGLRKGENLHVQVAAQRLHGFKGVINVAAENLPPGITCKGASIGESVNFTTLVFTAAEDVKPGTWPIQIKGASDIDSVPAVAAVTAAEAALKKNIDAVPALDKALVATVKPLADADAARKKADDAAKVDAAALAKADEAKKAADKKVTDSDAAAKAADIVKKDSDKKFAEAKTAAAKTGTDLTTAQAALDKDKENQELKDKVAAAQKAKTDADAALATADQAAKDSATKLTQATTLLNQAKSEAQKATTAFNQAKAKADQTKKTFDAAKAKHDQEIAKNKAADDKQKAGKAAIVTAQKDLDAKRQARKAAVRPVSHSARTATVVWNGSNVAPAITRLSRNLTLSVIDELAPVQATTDVFREIVSHTRSLLVPVKLTKRNGFDLDVQLNFLDVPKNVKPTNVKIAKGQTEGIARLDIPANVAEGTYTLHLQAIAKPKYQRNLVRLERAKAAQKPADDALKAAQEAAKTAVATVTAAQAALTAANKETTDGQNKLNADKQNLTKAQTAEKAVTTAKAKTDKAVTDAQTATQTATKAAADAKTASDADAENEDLKKKLEAANKAKVDADAALKAAQDAAAAEQKKLTEAQAVVKTMTDAVAASEKALEVAKAKVKTTTEAKAKADAAKVAADAAVKAADTKKKAADKEVADATKNSAAKDVNVFAASTPIVITVKKGAFTIAAAVPGGGNLKRGQKLETKVTVKRINGFTGPVTVNLALPPGVKGVTAAPVTIPADQTEGTLVVSAAGDATEGQIAHLFVRGTGEWNGPTSADIAATIKVAK